MKRDDLRGLRGLENNIVGESVPKEQYDALKALLAPLRKIVGRMDGQDNRATFQPIFVVQQKRRIYGMDDDACEKVWIYDGSEIANTAKDLENFLREYEMTKAEAVDQGSLYETGYMDIYESVQPFFSQKAADDYIESNRHNLKDPRVYTDSAYRNTEWQAVRGVLLALAEMGND